MAHILESDREIQDPFQITEFNSFFKHKRVFYHKFVDLVFWPQQDLNYQIYLNELGNST